MTEQLSVSNQKEVPKRRDALQEKYDKEPKKPEKDLTSETAKLPKPTGWRLLVLPFKMKEKTKGGILITDDVIERSQVASTCGLVLDVGPDAYRDKKRFNFRIRKITQTYGLETFGFTFQDEREN